MALSSEDYTNSLPATTLILSVKLLLILLLTLHSVLLLIISITLYSNPYNNFFDEVYDITVVG